MVANQSYSFWLYYHVIPLFLVPSSDKRSVAIAYTHHTLVNVNLYGFSMSLIRISVTLFYARIFRYSRTFHAILWINGVLNVIYFILWTILNTWSLMIALHKLEGRRDPHPQISGQIWTTLAAVILDLIVLILPLPLLRILRISMVRKVGVYATFLLGYVYVLHCAGLDFADSRLIRVPIFTFARLLVFIAFSKNKELITSKGQYSKPNSLRRNELD